MIDSVLGKSVWESALLQGQWSPALEAVYDL